MPVRPKSDQPSADQQAWEIADCFFELIGGMAMQAEALAQRMSIPAPFLKALHILDHPIAMKEMGKRLHCDPSFVTLVTDMLEKHGLARREPNATDRRVKNIVLTSDGEALKHKIEAEISSRMPWNRALDESERAQLLALLRKMLRAEEQDPEAAAAADQAQPGSLSSLLKSALKESITQSRATTKPGKPGNRRSASPPASTGEVTGVSQASSGR